MNTISDPAATIMLSALLRAEDRNAALAISRDQEVIVPVLKRNIVIGYLCDLSLLTDGDHAALTNSRQKSVGDIAQYFEFCRSSPDRAVPAFIVGFHVGSDYSKGGIQERRKFNFDSPTVKEHLALFIPENCSFRPEVTRASIDTEAAIPASSEEGKTPSMSLRAAFHLVPGNHVLNITALQSDTRKRDEAKKLSRQFRAAVPISCKNKVIGYFIHETLLSDEQYNAIASGTENTRPLSECLDTLLSRNEQKDVNSRKPLLIGAFSATAKVDRSPLFDRLSGRYPQQEGVHGVLIPLGSPFIPEFIGKN